MVKKNKIFQTEKLSKRISYILRHNPDPLYMDENGWVSVQQLLNYLDIIKWDLDYIVDTNNKKRFSYNEDETLIRANQGHSLKNVDVELEEKIPPRILFHGTSQANERLILSEGIKKMNRQHVHLSSNFDTATNVGQRHGKPKVFGIDALQMHKDGKKFYLSKNGVWLTDYINPDYIIG